MKHMKYLPILFLLCLGTALYANDSGFLVRETELKREPFSDAESGAVLPAQTQVEIVARRGAWLQVKAGEQGNEQTGWVRLLAVRTAPSAKSGEIGVIKAINVARSGASGATVATGVRGLSKEDLASATPNPVELERMGKLGVSEAEARAFAGESPALTEADVEYLKRKDKK